MSEDLSKLRGMSEPFPFTFSVRKPDKALICHAVIFTSYELRDGEAKIGLLTEESDPRVANFLKYIWTNFLKEKRAELEEALRKAEQSETVALAELIGKQLAEKQLKKDQTNE